MPAEFPRPPCGTTPAKRKETNMSPWSNLSRRSSSFTIIGGAVDMKGHNITIEDGVTINYLVNAIQAVTEKSMAAFKGDA